MKATEELLPEDERVDDNVYSLEKDVPEHEIDLLQLAWRAKWLLAGGLAAGILLGQSAYWKLGPEYEAKTQVLVSKKAAALNEQGEAVTYGDRAEHIALIMSPMIVGAAVERQKLGDLPSLAESEDPVEDILGSLKVKRSAGHDKSFLNVLDVSYRNPRPRDAEAVVTAVIEAYRAYLSDSYEQNTRDVLQLVEEASQDLHQQLMQKEQEYLEFRDSVPMHWGAPPGAELSPGSSTNPHADNLRAIENERRANLLQQAELQSKIRTLREALEDGRSPAALTVLVQQMMTTSGTSLAAGSPSGPAGTAAAEAQLLPLLLEEKRLLRDFGADHPDVQSVRHSIETIREFYRQRGISVPRLETAMTAPESSDAPAESRSEESATVYLQALEQQLTQLEHREEELQRLHAEELQNSKRFARYQAEDQKRHEELQRIKGLWNAVISRLNRQSLDRQDSGYTVRKMAPVHSEFVWKRQFKFLGAGSALGLALVAGAVYLRTWHSTTFHSLDEVRRGSIFPMVGSIPEFVSAEPTGATQEATWALRPELCYYHDPGSSEAEAYRTLRTTLSIGPGTARTRVLQITSPEPGDGKTTLACNLAMALAHSGKRVLLIDADLRRPRVHELFAVSQDVGLADALTGDIEWLNAACATVVEGLWLLTAGTSVAAPAEMLASPRFERLLQHAKTEFDYVVVDTPPLLAVSDAWIATAQTDGVLLVVRLSKTRKAAYRQAAELLETRAVRVIGTVANGAEPAPDEAYGEAYDNFQFPTGGPAPMQSNHASGPRELPLEVS